MPKAAAIARLVPQSAAAVLLVLSAFPLFGAALATAAAPAWWVYPVAGCSLAYAGLCGAVWAWRNLAR